MRRLDLMISIQCVLKAYAGRLKPICMEFGLTFLEVQVITILHFKPEVNTVGDIAEYWLLSKGNVSRAVEQLIQKGYVSRKQDTEDRRKVYLSLLPAAAELAERIDRSWDDFCAQLFEGFSSEEFNLYESFKEKLLHNAKNIIEKNAEEKIRNQLK